MKKILLQAGRCQVQYQQGALRYLRVDGHELVRGLYFALRDANWGTVPFRIENEHHHIEEKDFLLHFEAIHFVENQDVFSWKVRLEGTAQQTLHFSIEGTALAPFWRNRAGFCVLHPLKECVGQPVQIVQPDGQISVEVFPSIIAPNGPFPYIRAMRWQVHGVGAASLTLEGDDFEIEDQRNWGDGSFKTFCTPLAQPFPVALQTGDTVSQKITFALTPQAQQPLSDEISVAAAPAPSRSFPRIGTLQSFEKKLFSAQEIAALRALQLDHLRVEIDLQLDSWRQDLQEGYAQAQAIGAGLFLALTLSENSAAQAADFLGFVQRENISIVDLLLLQKAQYATPTSLLNEVLPAFRKALPGTRLGAGTGTNYTELGRHLPEATGLDFVAYGFQPQEHASDDQSLIENMESQTAAVLSAQTHFPEKDIYVSPISFKKRFNPYTQNPADRFVEQPLSAQYDERLRGDLGAGWLLGTLRTVAEAGAQCLTLCRATGPLGLVQEDPIVFYDILQKIQSFKGAKIHPFPSANPLEYSVFMLEKKGKKSVFVANHTAESLEVEGPEGQPISLAGFEVKNIVLA
jgi:D-apionolactonase